MRIALVLALLLALLPPSFGWNPSRTDCCADSCTCTSAEEPSCCEKDEGPVYVAPCGCGHSHGPLSVHRPAFDWAPLPRPTGLELPAPSSAPAARVESFWPAPAPRPEPPPPRSACASM